MAVIYGINGPVLKVSGRGFAVAEMVTINGKPGEVIAISPSGATIQVYESTAGLRPGVEVVGTGRPMSVTMRPGIMGQIFDGIMRPLKDPEAENFTYSVRVLVEEGQALREGEIFAEAAETPLITYKATVPTGLSGMVINRAPDGEYRVDDTIITLSMSQRLPGQTESDEAESPQISLTLSQTWPIRVPRPVAKRYPPDTPLITGQRIIDSLFPIAKGGACAIPGGFGTGKTMTQHQLAKWCDADIIVYIGCGERGNEMTEVLEDFGKLKDPKSGQPLLARTVLIANTSDMPVAAREAGIYTGITLAEFYRDMGYHVALMADSTSRWAEALRELSSRLEEIPAEEGYPAYLATRLAAFYGRAGYVKNLNGTSGSITIIGAVSPQGADFSEPVTLHTKRFTRCYWALDRRLAYARHFPAIDWMTSYSGYAPDLEEWYVENISPKFPEYRRQILKILQEENALQEIVKLIGSDALSDAQRLTMSIARVIRQGFAQQNAYHPIDTYTPPARQFEMMEIILNLYETLQGQLAQGIAIPENHPAFEEIINMKYNRLLAQL
ncbi:MAG: V-type ATP synthase subunit A [Defluviitaleaceae bacterium]|nr:V-type ATP synthase subunit A [Defluviitaleaceae bacterium]